MTADQERAIKQADALLKKAFAGFYGSIRFNLHPKREDVNINIEESKILRKGEPK